MICFPAILTHTLTDMLTCLCLTTRKVLLRWWIKWSFGFYCLCWIQFLMYSLRSTIFSITMKHNSFHLDSNLCLIFSWSLNIAYRHSWWLRGWTTKSCGSILEFEDVVMLGSFWVRVCHSSLSSISNKNQPWINGSEVGTTTIKKKKDIHKREKPGIMVLTASWTESPDCLLHVVLSV